ncbi:MAG: tRNA epoxyqueuosine(34) reductase QueG, partial [Pseudomonadota bacterium]
LGFAAAKIADPRSIPDVAARMEAFLAEGRHGQMGWLAERLAWRSDPTALWPDVRSVIMLADLYTPSGDALEGLLRKDCGNISVYARHRDYHDTIKKRLKRLARWLIAEAGGEVKVFVDTAPVAEKPLAEASGLGWQGKHTNLVSRSLGNWFFLGAIFTTLPLETDNAGADHCGSCRACLDICPTDAFPAPYQLDARRCISYLTIEHRGPIDEDLRSGLGNRIYGCDDCLAVCPWNKFAKSATEMRYEARPDLINPPLEELADLQDGPFRERFSGSPIKRIGRNRFVRNVAYAIGNSGEERLLAKAQALAEDADAAVAEAAQWAALRLMDQAKPNGV